MVLKNLIKAKKGHADPLSDDAPLVASGLLPGFEALPTVVLVLDKHSLRVVFANPTAEAMLELSRRQLQQMGWSDLFSNADELIETIAAIGENRFHATRLDVTLERVARESLHVHAIVGFLESAPDYVLLELFENERHLRSDREERIQDMSAANR
ncbi:MAG TPA: PAS domain-containing protein, partial [Paraburkholderia sp.]